MSDNRVSRREFMHHSLLLGGLAAGGAAVLGVACGSSGGAAALTCTDTSALSEADKGLRTQLQYVDRSPDPTKTCLACRFFTAPQSATACGSCSLVKGPINPQGKCSSWVAKA